jgi:hypothetical protein
MLKARLARQQDLADEADRFNPQANGFGFGLGLGFGSG